MSTKNQRILYFVCILLGGILVFTEQAKEHRENPYLLILGFVLLMFGLYRATTGWVKDNPREDGQNDPGAEGDTEDTSWKNNGQGKEEDTTK